MKWLVVCVIALMLAVGCGPRLGERPALPTAVAGVASNGAVAPTRRALLPTPSGPTSTPAPWATAVPTGLPPPAPVIPHAVEGNEDCIRCHMPHSDIPLPLDHFKRKPGTCLGCHAIDAGWLPTPAPVGHALAGHEACLTCHLEGANDAPVVPGDHAGRTNDTCTTCHKPNS